MSIISNLVIRFTAEVAGFTKKTGTLRKDLKKLSKDVGKDLKSIASYTAAGAVAAGVGLAALVRNSMNTIDNLNDMSGALGISTEGLSKLKFAANLSGTSIEDVGTALKKMQQNIANNAGKEGDVFKMMGLSALELVNLKPEQAFERIAAAISKMQNPAMKTKFMMDAFGKSGTNLANMLDGLSENYKDAEKLGYVISSIDASKIASANDSIDKMKMGFEAIINRLAVGVAKYLQYVSEWITKLASDGTTSTQNLEVSFKSLNIVIGYLINTFKFVSAAWNLFSGVIQKGISYILKGISYLVSIFDDDLAESFDSWAKEYSDYAEQQFSDAGKNWADAFTNNYGEALEKSLDKINKNIIAPQLKTPQIMFEDDFKKATENKTTKQYKHEAYQYNSNQISLKGLRNQADYEMTKEQKKTNQELRQAKNILLNIFNQLKSEGAY